MGKGRPQDLFALRASVKGPENHDCSKPQCLGEKTYPNNAGSEQQSRKNVQGAANPIVGHQIENTENQQEDNPGTG